MLKLLFALIAVCVIGIMYIAFLPLKPPPLVGVKGSYSLSRVHIVDTISGGILSDMTVLIDGSRISAIVPASQYQPSANYVDIPAEGKFLLPGFWDMHTHSLKLSPQLHHPLFIRYGVTSVRDMSGCLNAQDSYWACPRDRVLWDKQAVMGERVSPRYPLQSSYQTNGGNEVPQGFPDFFRLANKSDAQELVDFYVGRSVDFIKTYTELTSEQFNNLLEASALKDIAVAGHKPLTVPLVHALNGGMKSIEHGRLFMFECFEGIDRFRQLDDPISQYNAQFMRKMLRNQNSQNCARLMDLMASSATYWVPTLTTLKMSAMSREPSFRRDKRLEYIPYIVHKLLWEQDINRASQKGFDQQLAFVHEDFYREASAHVGLANRRGVKLLAGTDNIDTYVFTGASLHDELGMLVDAGLTPLQAIQTATINPARFSNLESDFGSVEVGKQADLLLLNTNPLLNIQNTTDIYGVMFAGQYFDQEAMSALDNFAVEMANSIQINMRFLLDIFASPLMRTQLAD